MLYLKYNYIILCPHKKVPLHALHAIVGEEERVRGSERPFSYPPFISSD